jgi:hypothetical protein
MNKRILFGRNSRAVLKFLGPRSLQIMDHPPLIYPPCNRHRWKVLPLLVAGLESPKQAGLSRWFMSIALATAFLLVAVFSGCCSSKQCQLENVAKDWCMTIRASQVIPVYPLTEDVQPGDLFLVQTPIDKQQKIYNKKGFLPLDQHVARLNPQGYPNFYAHSFLTQTGSVVLPKDWARPGNANISYWQPAPHAGFPTYSFSVRRGEGINLAVPVDGVPVGLSLLNSDAASGTVTIDKSQTIGVDTVSLWRELEAWVSTNHDFLSFYAPNDKETNYLRVVTRIYTVGQIDVSLTDASSQSGGLDVGAAKPVNLLFPQLPNGQTNTSSTVAQNYTNGWSALQSMLAAVAQAAGSNNFLPGGSLRLAGASARTVALEETLAPPLVIGYLGFDCAILGQGILGPPIPTHAHLNQTVAGPSSYGADPNTSLIRNWLRANMVANQTSLLQFINAQPGGDTLKQSDIPYVLNQSKYATLRQQVVNHFALAQ